MGFIMFFFLISVGAKFVVCLLLLRQATMEHAGESGDRPPWSMLVRVETGHHGACW